MNKAVILKRTSILFSILAFVLPIWGQNANFEEANNAYKEGKYDVAISAYKSLLDDKKQSATIYYNLGNAYFKKGILSQAILNYERAYRMQPYDKDIQLNLAFANSQIADKIETPKRYFITKWFYKLSQQLHSNTWAYLGIGFWILVFLFIIFFIKTTSESMRKWFFLLATISLFATFFTFYATYSQYTTNKTDAYAIVFAQNITIKSTPSNNGTDLFILHEGTKVQLLDKVGTWYKIQLADGREGWMPSKTIVEI